MITLNGKEYKLVFLDTNALREVATDVNNARQGFFKKFLIQNTSYIPCFSIYNIIELKPYDDFYKLFLEIFGSIPCFMFFPLTSIIYEEFSQYKDGQSPKITNKIVYAFNPNSNNSSDNLSWFLEHGYNDDVTKRVKDEISLFPTVLKIWESQRLQYAKELEILQLPRNIIDDKYYLFNEHEAISKDLENRGINIEPSFSVESFPSLRMIEYSHFKHVHQTIKAIKINDILDIEISGAVPYVDCVITEAFQADIYKKAKKIIPTMSSLEVLTLKDIRMIES